MSNEVTTKDQFELVFNAIRGLQTVQAISLGIELGLFSSLVYEGPQTPALLARDQGLHEPYVRVWCEAAYAFGLLEIDDAGRYRLAPKMDVVLLDTSHPRYLGAFARGLMEHGQADFARTKQAFIDGSVYPFGTRGPEFSQWVSSLTHPMQRLVVGKVLPEILGAELERGIAILDVGCGAGALLFKLAQAYPNCTLVGVDVDEHGIALARERAEFLGLRDRIEFRHLQAGEPIPYTDAFDLALMFEVFHELPVDVRPDVLAGTFAALKPGGRLFIVDETWPENPAQLRDPAYAMSIMVQFSELIWGNVVATESEQTRLLSAAGFHDLQRGDLGGVFTTILAHK